MPNNDRFLLAGVMGWPVMHSRSPLMHNYWFEQLDIQGTYVPLAIQPAMLEKSLRALHPLGFSGCNLTIPHKQSAMKIVDELDEVAKQIGAINCVVVREDGSLFGTNNDWNGFIRAMKHELPDWRADSGPVVVLGAGGGARAVCHGLITEGAQEIRLVNRTDAKSHAIAAEFGEAIHAVSWSDRHDALEGALTVVNTTSLGMTGQPALDLDLDTLPAKAVASDIVYTPLETSFLSSAAKRGNATVGGLGMLIHQAVPAWKLWFGLEPIVTNELRRLLEASIQSE